MGTRPGSNKNHYTVVEANNKETFEQRLHEATNKIHEQEGARHYATQTHVNAAAQEGGSNLYTAVLFYDYDDDHQPESLSNKKLCPECGVLIPKAAEAHLKCGWGVIDETKELEREDVEIEGDYPESDSLARDLED